MLNLGQSNEYRRFKSLNDYFKVPANIVIMATYPPFKDEVIIYEGNFTKLDLLLPDKGVLYSGITTDKGVDKETIATGMALICKKAKAFAIKTGNTVLEKAVNVTSSEIIHKKEADILPFVVNTIAAITPFLTNTLFVPYGITSAKLATQLANATTYNATIGVAGGIIKTSDIANKNINNTIKLLQTSLHTFDLLIDEFEVANPNFVAGYHLNAEAQHIGIHHTGVKGAVKDSETSQPIFGATIKIIGGAKHGVTNLLGQYVISPVATKLYQLEVTAPGYVSQIVIFHILNGEIGIKDFALVKL